MQSGQYSGNLLQRFLLVFVNYPRLTAAVILGVTALFAFQLRLLHMEPDISEALPKWVPAKKAYDLMGKLFPSRDFMLVVIKSPDGVFSADFIDELDKLTKHIEELPQVYSAVSPANARVISSSEGVISIKPMVEVVPPVPDNMQEFRRVFNQEIPLKENLVSSDEMYAGIMVFLRKGVRPEEGAEAVLNTVEKEIHRKFWFGAAGRPVINYHLGKGMARDMGILTTVAVIIAFVILYLTFRTPRGIFLPFAVVAFTIVWTLGTMASIHHPISHSTNIMPILLFSIGLADSIHLLSRYFSALRTGKENGEAVRFSLKELNLPVIFTSFTTMGGFLALLTSGIRSLGELAVFTSLGVFYALIITLTLLPSALVLLGRPRRLQDASAGLGQNLHSFVWLAVSRWRKYTIALFVLFMMFLAWGYTRIHAEFNSLENFRKSSNVRQTMEVVNRIFAGSVSLSIMVSGSDGQMLEPDVVRRIYEFEKFLRSIPHVNEAFSYADLVALMNRVFTGKEEIPRQVEKVVDEATGKEVSIEGKELIAQYLELYEMSGRGEEVAASLDYRRANARIIAFLDTEAGSVLSGVRKKVLNYLEGHMQGLTFLLDGMSEVVLAVNDLVVRGQKVSLVASLSIIFILNLILFRSLRYGLLSIVPLIFALFVNFGLMGVLKIPVNLMTMVTTNIAIGVGVDYAIHYLFRLRTLRAWKLDDKSAVRETLEVVARPISMNALATGLGFSVMVFSTFVSVAIMGFLIALAMVTTCTGALLILPLINQKGGE